MRQNVRQGIQVLRRAHEFLAGGTISSEFGPITPHVATLAEINTQLSAHSVDQDQALRNFRGHTTAARKQATKLRVQLMRPISRMARSLFPDEPMLLNSLAMPVGKDYERLLAGATAMSQVVEAHKERFTAAGFPGNFIDVLKGGATALRATLDARNAALGHRAAATAGMTAQLRRGRDLVRLLDDLVSEGLKDAAQRSEWATLTRFIRSSRVRADNEELPAGSGSTPPDPQATPPVATPATPQSDALPKAA